MMQRPLQLLILLLAVLGATECAYAESTSRDRVKLDSETACVVAATTTKPRFFRAVDDRVPNPVRKEVPEPIEIDPKDGRFGGMWLDAPTCEAFRSGTDDLVFVRSKTRWFARSDFADVSTFERVGRWTTRYTWFKSYLSGAYSEDMDPLLAYAAGEIGAYQASTIREGLHLFTSDGHWLDPDLGYRRWEMRRSPTGRIFLVDPAGRYLPMTENFSSYFTPHCSRDPDGKLRCGLAWFSSSAKCLHRPDSGMRGCMEYAPGTEDPKVGQLVLQDPIYTEHEITPTKIILHQRVGPRPIQREGRFVTHSYNFYTEFEDPIRPVVFAPGVLFKPSAKPRRDGKYPASVRVMREVCVADCPDQLKLQGLIQ